MEDEMRKFITEHYAIDSENGLLFRKLKNGLKPAGITKTQAGYLQIGFDRFGSCLMHRVVWEMVNGNIPEGMQIDHINHIRTDNRLCNLRLATPSENQHNNSIHKKRQYGVIYKGVCFDKHNNCYRADIQFNKKHIALGQFATQEEAALAYNKAAIEFYGEFAFPNAIALESSNPQ